jgi:RND family efflux transporter MFP subunit
MNADSPGSRIPVPRRSPVVSGAIVIAAAVAVLTGAAMMLRAEAKTNDVALSASAKKVSYVLAKGVVYRDARTYVGTLRPWVEANVGPQLISGYVDTVLVRPGTLVRKGEVLATLDCRNASTASNAIALQARAIEARQKAVEDESDRTQKLLHGGYASANEAEQALAQSAAEAAQLGAQRATLAHSSLEVGDCVLRAPFDGEIGDRFIDPGAYARPGTAVVSVIDRSTVRFSADVPEADFAVVPPKAAVRIHVDASSLDLDGTISRRAPHADAQVRTIHFEVDLPNHDRTIPVDTTGEVRIEFGDSVPATEIPLYAAAVRGARATLFVVDGKVARTQTVAVLGEIGSALVVARALTPDAEVITEGRALLDDGDLVDAKEEHSTAPSDAGASTKAGQP